MSGAGQGATEQEVAADGGAPSKKKKIILIAAVVVVLLAIGGGETTTAERPAGSDGDSEFVPQKEIYFYDLPEVTVNLATQGQAAYLKVRVSLEVADREVANQIEPFLPRVMDVFQVYLRELRPTDLEGSAGLCRLKEELLRRINVAVYPARVDGVLFKEILVQ
ncbi:flagellar basal body-associated FliL family protein [Breoghania sp.]|uniref:flagellar basal body-associated FliL family protein n=1 Tax=Breoghania sp. TaxID=2065378 RepID=UPI002605B686|nr:flagellar basal body-associated FliL family protein [Breoghania sp.]MDJ0932096.1 flagellar basal body-associated FliL family protein [Breoghania sp.]